MKTDYKTLKKFFWKIFKKILDKLNQMCYNTNTVEQDILKRGLYYEQYQDEKNRSYLSCQTKIR
jgi:hypothetical protein